MHADREIHGLQRLYVELLRDALLGYLIEDDSVATFGPGSTHYTPRPFDATTRDAGRDWPSSALTMIGRKRMDNIAFCVRDILRKDIPGDLLEAGVWRGGATIFMRGLLKVYGDRTRRVFVADSFEGFPPPNNSLPNGAADIDLVRHNNVCAVDLDEVRANFRRFGLLDERVRFVPGWFSTTLHDIPVVRLALLRLDCDLFESTRVALEALYSRVSRGGYVIVDDYFAIRECRLAVDQFRQRNHVREELFLVDRDAVFWRKEEP